ncbi:GlxA family transcriptional regulator [Bdellovibrio sp. HCB288]|uniref:GlxA family transcriptional regulator n=1 Tax=Bdellovibrio sp. HCB288 TaxID=3394355 RepID=UPI0039B36C06
MMKSSQMTEVAILLSPYHQQSAVNGLLDLFQIANLYAVKFAQDKHHIVRVTQWRTSSAKTQTMECVSDTHPEGKKSDPDFIIIPPSLNNIISAEDSKTWTPWILKGHSKGSIICSICSGAFLLGETGLLDGRPTTTHWFFNDQFKQRFPKTLVDTDKILIDDGDIITVGGLMAWVDLGLSLVDRLLGPTIMIQTAQFLLVDPNGREQRHYSHFTPVMNHGDESILKAQHWLQKNTKNELNITVLADKSGLSERTFLRRFNKATGLNPTAYCQKLRVSKARELLEFTKKNVEQIAWDVGYEDPGAFRKVFHKVMGLTPGEYRHKFHMR